MALNRARVSKDIGIDSGFSVYLASIEFFDSADPNTVIWTETMQVPFGSSTSQLSTLVIARGQTIRTALALQAAAIAAVPAGTTITVP